MKTFLVSCLVSVLALSASAQVSPTTRNTVNGAMAGALIGGVVGHNSGSKNTGKGAAIGAIAGSILGYVNTRNVANVQTVNTVPVYGQSYDRGYAPANTSSLDAEIAQATREAAILQAEADRIRSAYDVAQQRANEVRSRLYNLTNARESLNAARR